MFDEIISILWRRVDQPGHEGARLFRDQAGWHLAGTALFVHETQPCRLDYVVACDSNWNTRSAEVVGWIGSREIHTKVEVADERQWKLNGEICEAAVGCVDLDLNFSPSTNLLPIRRLNLPTGGEAKVRAAWLRFPSFTLEPLEQVYRRLGAQTYRYESRGGAFVAQLEVNASGLVVEYPGFWSAEAPRPRSPAQGSEL